MRKLKLFSIVVVMISAIGLIMNVSQTKAQSSKYKHHISEYGPIIACNGSAKNCSVIDGVITDGRPEIAH